MEFSINFPELFHCFGGHRGWDIFPTENPNVLIQKKHFPNFEIKIFIFKISLN